MNSYNEFKLGGPRPSLEGVEVSELAKELLEKTSFEEQSERSVNLVVVSLTDLGFSEEPLLDQIYEAAKNKGYSLCPAEVGPRLRQADPSATDLYIAMEPIEVSYHGFTAQDPRPVERCIYWLRVDDGVVCLTADTLGDPTGDDPWNLRARFVFQAP